MVESGVKNTANLKLVTHQTSRIHLPANLIQTVRDAIGQWLLMRSENTTQTVQAQKRQLQRRLFVAADAAAIVAAVALEARDARQDGSWKRWQV
jgi:hypothetical protein